MEHVVFFPSHDGTPAFRRTANLEDAVRLVEHLRNVEGINEVSCHALSEVPLAFRTYYRVEVPGAEEAASAAPAQPVAVEVPAAESAPDQALETAVVAEAEHVETPSLEPDPVLASSNGHATDGAKSLGFFA